MGNLKNFYSNHLSIFLSNIDYWDFYLANDESPLHTIDDCPIVLFDFNEPNIYFTGFTSANTISSLVTWTGATNTGYTFDTIGLTGIDNGLITFETNSGDTTNQGLLSALTGTTLIIPPDDYRLHFNRITGTTNQFIYPIDIELDYTGQYAALNGGFYQGYYKIDGSTYQVLPDRVPKAWVAQFWLKPRSISSYTGTTLNDVYSGNTGFFFYMGTRAENKFWDRFNGADTGCTSGCTVDSGCTDTLSPWCTVVKEPDILIKGSDGTLITLYPNRTTSEIITNPFLLYGRAGHTNNSCYACGSQNPSGLGNQTVCGSGLTSVKLTKPLTVKTNFQNPFLIYGRAGHTNNSCYACGSRNPSGLGNQTVYSFSGFNTSVQFDNLDYRADTYDNAIGFRITPDGRIGYRSLSITGTCSGETTVTGYTISEGYSLSGMVVNNQWTSIIIRYSMYDYYNDCDLKSKKERLGRLSFYINGKLKYYVDNFPEFIGKRLNDYPEKQVGVPFNFSLGGGTQGLIETQTFDGRDLGDLGDLGLPIEQNFAGSFIGDISQFKFNICDLYFDDITNIYNNEVIRYLPQSNLLTQEDGYLIFLENGYGILI